MKGRGWKVTAFFYNLYPHLLLVFSDSGFINKSFQLQSNGFSLIMRMVLLVVIALNHPNGEVIDLRWWLSSVLVALLRSTNGVHTHCFSADNLLHFTRWNGLFCLMFWCSLYDELIGNAEWWGRGLSWFWFFLNKW